MAKLLNKPIKSRKRRVLKKRMARHIREQKKIAWELNRIRRFEFCFD